MKTIVEFALTHPVIKDPFKDFIKALKI